MKKVLICLSLPFVWLRKMFFPTPDDFKTTVNPSKIEDEEILAENVIKNNQEKLESIGIDPFKEPASNYIDIPKQDLVFEEKVAVSEKVKVEKSRRILTYKIETKQGLILFEGKKISKFIEESELDLGFTQREAYKFASRHQDKKLFKGKYFISFKEVPR